MRLIYLCNKSKKINEQEIVKKHLRPAPGNKSLCSRAIELFIIVDVLNIINRVFFFHIIRAPAGGHEPNTKFVFYIFCSPGVFDQQPQVNKIDLNRVPCFYRSCYSINRFYIIKLLLKGAKKFIPENKNLRQIFIMYSLLIA